MQETGNPIQVFPEEKNVQNQEHSAFEEVSEINNSEPISTN